jgi:hypothetical protein
MMFAAGAAELGGEVAIVDFQIHEALVLPDEDVRVTQTILTATGADARAQVHSRAENEERWRLHAEARLVANDDYQPDDSLVDLAELRARCSETIDSSAYYDALAELGLEFGDSFRGLRRIHRRNGEAIGLIELPSCVADDAPSYRIHPALLDSCFHLLGAALDDELQGHTYLLIEIDRFQVYERTEGPFWSHVTIRPASNATHETFGADVRLYDESGRVVAVVLGLQLKLASSEALARLVRRQAGEMLYEVAWQPAPQSDLSSAASIHPPAVAARIASDLESLADQHDRDI